VRRRELVALLAGAVADILRPIASFAQHSNIPTIGVLVVADPGSDRFWRLFRRALGELGYVDGKTVRFAFRSDQGQPDRLAGLAAELVGLKTDVIVTWFTPPAIAAKQATGGIPIVMAVAGDPIATGPVESLSRPGENVTGMSGEPAELVAKIVEFVRDMLPSARRIPALVNAPNPFSKPFLEQVRGAGTATGTTVDPLMLHNIGELDGAFEAIERQRPDTVIVQPSLGLGRVAQLALKYRVPAVCPLRSFADGHNRFLWLEGSLDADRVPGALFPLNESRADG